MVSLLNAYSDNTDKLAASVAECRRLGIRVMQPDVLLSDTEFAVEKSNGSTSIRFGLANVKNVGESAIEPFVKSRAEAEETPGSIEEMCRAVDMSSLTKKTLESLTMAGALDRFGGPWGDSRHPRPHTLAGTERGGPQELDPDLHVRHAGGVDGRPPRPHRSALGENAGLGKAAVGD